MTLQTLGLNSGTRDWLAGLPVPELLTFLVGAGISHDLPGVKPVISALLGTLVDARFANNLLFKKDPLLEGSIPVRFEFLMQMIRDYVSEDLGFLVQIYDTVPRDTYQAPRVRPNAYHCTLASLLTVPERVAVTTTNFDRQIETAYFQLTGGQLPSVAYSDSDFERLDRVARPSDLLKLHGSVHDERSLCVTFEGVGLEEERGPKHRVLSKLLRQRALCVAGYGGSDDDVLQVLFETEAREQPIYWFTHASEVDEPRWFVLRDVPEDRGSWGQKVVRTLMIFRRLAERGVRDPDKLYLVVGNTGRTLSDFVDRLDIPGVRGWEFNGGPIPKPREPHPKTLIRKWLRITDHKLGGLASFHGLLACIELAYTTEDKRLMRRVMEKLVNAAGLSRELRAISLPRQSMTALDDDEFDEAEQLADRGITEAESLIGDSGTDKFVLHSLLESYAWKGEAQRMHDKPREALETVKKGMAVADHLMMGNTIPSWRALLRPKAALYACRGESLLQIGEFREAEGAYKDAERHYREARDPNWLLYARLGTADVARMRGNIAVAEDLYRELAEDAELTGWITWLPIQINISRLDIMRMRYGEAVEQQVRLDEERMLKEVCGNSIDKALRLRGRALRWERTWLSQGQVDWAACEREYKVLRRQAPSDGDLYHALLLSYSEFLKRRGSDRWGLAADCCAEVIAHAASRNLPMLSLYARTILADLSRIRGDTPKWESCLEEFDARGSEIGVLYATLVGRLAGASVSAETMDRVCAYSERNGLGSAAALLKKPAPGRGAPHLRLTFPGTLTVF